MGSRTVSTWAALPSDVRETAERVCTAAELGPERIVEVLAALPEVEA